MSASSSPAGLLSANTVPERAKRLIGQMIENVKGKYNIYHAGNSESK